MNKYIPILLCPILVFACTSDRTYNLDTLNKDITQFDEGDQRKIVEFSNMYEKGKQLFDSINGVPVVLVQSLTYQEILERMKAYEAAREKIRIEFSWRVMRQLGTMSENVDTLRLPSFEKPVILFTQHDLRLPTELMLKEGRGFSEVLDKEKDVVIISSTLQDKINLQLGDIISLDKNYKVLGITAGVDVIRPYDPTFFAIRNEPKRSNRAR